MQTSTINEFVSGKQKIMSYMSSWLFDVLQCEQGPMALILLTNVFSGLTRQWDFDRGFKRPGFLTSHSTIQVKQKNAGDVQYFWFRCVRAEFILSAPTVPHFFALACSGKGLGGSSGINFLDYSRPPMEDVDGQYIEQCEAVRLFTLNSWRSLWETGKSGMELEELCQIRFSCRRVSVRSGLFHCVRCARNDL